MFTEEQAIEEIVYYLFFKNISLQLFIVALLFFHLFQLCGPLILS